jgi:hypothetical protein
MIGDFRQRLRIVCLTVILVFLPALVQAEEKQPTTLVGMRGRLNDVILPGPQLEVRPLEDSQAPFVLRVVHVSRHGTAFRYDFEYYGLEPRTYDLTQYLRPKDGSARGKLPALPVEVKGLLGPGTIPPHPLEAKSTHWFAAYGVLLGASAVLWTIGLVLLIFWGRRRNRAVAQAELPDREALADRLRPLVVRAMMGLLSPGQQAELERTLLAFWQQRLGLENETAAQSLAKMRQHPEAAILLNQLELWLHRPGTAPQVDVGKLLWPYQETPAPKAAGGAPAPRELA